MSRCGCDGAYCACFFEEGDGVTITGAGSELSPYVITADAVPADTDVAIFSRDEAELTTGTGTSVLMLPFAYTILGVSAAVFTAPTDDDIILDLLMGGVTLFTTPALQPTIPDGDTDTGTETVPDITAIPAFSHLTLNRDQVGATIPGGPLTVFVRYSVP